MLFYCNSRRKSSSSSFFWEHFAARYSFKVAKVELKLLKAAG
jgi:hypothetical protein